MYLYLVRHGKSEGNIVRTFHGWTDYPLIPLGHEQARQVAEKLKEVSFTRCCASDLQRAWITANYCLEGRGIVAESCPDLREHNCGDIEGLTWAEMDEKYPHIRDGIVTNWLQVTPPGGESPREMRARVGKRIDSIIHRGENTLVVAHNGTLQMILLHLGLKSEQELVNPYLVFRQGTYTAIEIDGGRANLLELNRG